MFAAQFKNLCRDAGYFLGVDDVDEFEETGRVEIDTLGVTLQFDETIASDRIVCYMNMEDACDMSSNPEAMRLLLALNMMTGTKSNGVYAMHPESGHPLFVVHLTDLDGYDGRMLANMLRVYAAHASAGIQVVRECIS